MNLVLGFMQVGAGSGRLALHLNRSLSQPLHENQVRPNGVYDRFAIMVAFVWWPLYGGLFSLF
jgi:hypothetical protein